MQGNPFKMTEWLTAKKKCLNEYEKFKVTAVSFMNACYQVANVTLKKQRIQVFTELLLHTKIVWT